MASYKVECCTPDDADQDRRIEGLGGIWGWFDIDDIIRRIESGTDHFAVTVAGRPVDVIVKQRGFVGAKYLTTEGDDFPPNNLLGLPECP